MADIAILYEHPSWFEPLFAALARRGIDAVPIAAGGHGHDPADSTSPAPIIFNRIAMSSFIRQADHPIYYAQALLQHWRDRGAHVINGPEAMAIDASKARQLSLIASLGLPIPETRVVHDLQALPAAADAVGYPLVVKANVGGSGAGIVRYDDSASLAQAIADRTVPDSIDKVLLAQAFVPARGGTITRLETLAGRFLYAIDVDGGGGFDLCPADICLAEPGKAAVTVARADPSPGLIAAAERIAQAAGLDVGGIEVMVDDRDGTARFYDINALSNFVANPIDVLGWDPHERLVDWIETIIAGVRA